MEQTEMGLTWMIQAVFLVVAGVAVRDALRSRLEGALAAATAAIVVASVASNVNAVLGYPSTVLSDVAYVALAVSGYGLVETWYAVVRPSRRHRGLVGGLLGAATLFVLAVRVPADPGGVLQGVDAAAVGLLVAVWVGCGVAASVGLVRASRSRPPVEAARLRLIGVGYAGIVLGILAIAATTYGDRPHGPVAVAVDVAVLLFVLPALYLAVSPPFRVRSRWLRRAVEREAGSLLPVGTWFWDRRADHLSWSSSVDGMLGVERDEHNRAKVFFDRVHPEDRETVRRALSRLSKERSPFALDVRILVEGEERWLNVRGRAATDPAGDGTVAILGTVCDVTERKRTEGKLREGRRELEDAQRLARVGSYRLDVGTGRVDWSSELFRIHGLDPSTFEPTLEGTLDLIHPEDRGWVEERLRTAMEAGEVDQAEYRVLLPDGRVRWMHGRAELLFDRGGELVGLHGTIQDVTERKEAEQALRRAYERERDVAERIGALDAMKEDFLEAVSHEFRTPITSLVGFAHMLELPHVAGDPEQVRHAAERIGVNADRLVRLLDELLDVDRATRGVLEVHRAPTDLARLVRSAVADVDLAGRDVDLDLGRVVAPVDPVQLERAVLNLVENAVLHTSPDVPVRIRLRSDGGEICLVVEDEGPGIPDEKKDDVFEPFYRGGSSAARAGGGGIGLALVKRVAELHGGTAWVEDRPEGGARFCVLLRPFDGDLEISSPEVSARTAP